MKSLITKLFTLLLCSTVFFTACDDSSSNSDDTTVEGLWKLQSTEGDVSYVNISTSIITDYDYQGDAFDEGEDCYIITTLEIVEINGDTYTIADPTSPETTVDMKITSLNDVLTVEQPIGNGTIIVKFNRFSGNVAEFSPECAEETGMIKSHTFGF